MARPSRQRTRPGLGLRGALILAVIAVGLAGWIYVSRPAHDPIAVGNSPSAILQHIPPGAMLVATVDIAALRHTALGKQLLGQGRTVAGLGEVATICGSDPMLAVERMAIAIPDAGHDAGFGLFASGAIVANQLIGCAEKIVAKGGGRPVRVPAGRFTVLKDASLELSSAELAAADGGPVILAEPTYVRAALGTEGAESMHTDARHAALRELVPAGQLVATAVLTAEQRRALIDELKAQNQADSPFRSVIGAALALSVDTRLEIAVAIRCDAAQACRRVAAHLLEAAKSEADTAAARAIGLGAVLERMHVETQGDAVHVRLAMPAADALSLLRRVLALRRLTESGHVPTVPQPSVVPRPPVPQPPVPAERGASRLDAGVGDAGVVIDGRPAPAPTSDAN